MIGNGKSALAKEAMDPKTSSRRLIRMFQICPLQVASNPNLSPEHMILLTQQCRTAFTGEDKPANEVVPLMFAVLWSLEENPSIPLLRLEHPNHPLFEHLRQCQIQVRIRLQLAQLSEAQLGLALLELLTSFSVLIWQHNRQYQFTWAKWFSGLWNRFSGLPVPDHLKDFDTLDLKFEPRMQVAVYWELQILRDALSSLSRDNPVFAFYSVYRSAQQSELAQALMTLEEASLGVTWPNRAQEAMDANARANELQRKEPISYDC